MDFVPYNIRKPSIHFLFLLNFLYLLFIDFISMGTQLAINLRRLQKVLVYVFLVIIFLILVSFLQDSLTYDHLGYQGVFVENDDPGSMYPLIKQGDSFIIFKTSIDKLDQGDIIVFVNEFGDRVIHRFIDAVEIEGDLFAVTKGDNFITNISPDEVLIPESAILGKVIFEVPLIGYFYMANTSMFQIFLILGSITIITLLLYKKGKYIFYEDEGKDAAPLLDLILFSIYHAIKSKHRWVLLTILVILLLIPMVILPAAIGTGKDPEIQSIEVSLAVPQIRELPEYNLVYTYYFVLLEINISDPGGFFDKVDHINFSLENETGSIVSTSVFSTLPLQRIIGEYTVGIGFCIDEQHISSLTQQFTLYAELYLNFGQSISFSRILVVSFQG